ncbi:HNH endonuclease signature motif containing protein [Microbacterium istanbulense]|uniref:DUF222 domain-containing protein n=1 Tax=Microbacterium istanbulense TaxID=3122049 RepID=A0ABU8LHT5_9MICO
MDEVDPFGIEKREALLDTWVQTRQRIAALEAEAARLLCERWELAEDDIADAPVHRDAIRRSMIAEYSAAGRVSKGSMEYAFADALHVHDLPPVAEAFAAGEISAAHVREIVRSADVIREAVATAMVPASTLQDYAEAVLIVAAHETPARTRVHARQVASVLAECSVSERHRQAMDERAVSVRPVGDGLALLTAVLPEYLAVAIHDRLTQLARTVTDSRSRQSTTPARSPWMRDDDDLEWLRDLPPEMIPDESADSFGTPAGYDLPPEAFPVPFDADYAFLGDAIFSLGNTFTTDPFGAQEHDARTMDQLRADLLSDLLLTSDPTAHGDGLDGIAARVQVTIAATTLAGADDRLAQLDGHGALHPDIARDIAARSGGWTRLFLDPAGQITATDTYSPTEQMRRRLRARDEHCRFVGCLAPVWRCDIDHQHDHARGGPTAIENLAHLCRAHHVLKHPDIPDAHRWTATQGEGGVLHWRSPLGRTYTDRPTARVMFV